MTATEPKRGEPVVVQFNCSGKATGKMRNDLSVRMVQPPSDEVIELATDEGAYHGGDATAPPPLSLFVASLTGCIMTQLRAFSRRMGVKIDDLNVETRVIWTRTTIGRLYETAPESIEIDVFLESSDADDNVVALIEAAKKGCFIEQTLGAANTITHRYKSGEEFISV